MRKNTFLAFAILIPIVVIIIYGLQNQYDYRHRQSIVLPISWKMDEKGEIFGYDLDFGFNPCSELANTNFQTLAVCLKPERRVYFMSQLPSSCTLFIKGFCAWNYFYARYSQNPSVDLSLAKTTKSKVEAVVKVSNGGFAEIIQLR
ncbi:hypothetical protein BN59_02781 [Legionella massiliensis]|uniref:Uncharacterized protein n=1 Tax=Legionella massiliensis TaxID=1034943 RepID=A0A078L028_9GAMM|nr:hypothetical protein [Legionella massiliensis]CDZ78471.1 hypothetical protein BN59_02781 [Legionella massiliensis]CEE14209.1 hypothetical protein BN1094_02781 [Legionella massiliensis]